MSLRKKALVVDDDNLDNADIRNALGNLHFEFELAGSLDEADSRAGIFDPHIILLDPGIPHSFHVPARVGFDEILGFIRRRKGKHAIVILTGNVDPDHVSQAMSAGACDYIDKDGIKDRQLFETRITNAIALHEKLLIGDSMAKILLEVATLWAKMDTVLKLMRLVNERVGTYKDKEIALVKEQVRKATTDEVNAKWRKWLFATGYAIGWGMWIALKAGFDKLLKKD